MSKNWELSEQVINSKDLDEHIYIEGKGVHKVQELIHSPKHYIGNNGLEVEEVLRNFIPRYEDSYVGHRVASAMEYLARAPLKNGLEDLKKARYNLDQAINHIEGENNEDKPIQGRNE